MTEVSIIDLSVGEAKSRLHEITFLIEQQTVDGADHKQWVIDQVMRIALGDKWYDIWRENHEKEYGWDNGITP